jgi:Fic family protein
LNNIYKDITIYGDRYLSASIIIKHLEEIQKMLDSEPATEKITNAEYQTLNSISKPTATRDLKELTDQLEILKNPGLGT